MSTDLKYQYARLNIAEKIIAINVVVFIITRLISVLFGVTGVSLVSWFELPKDFFSFITQPWSIITYSFLHGGFMHIFWNMLMLFYVGRMFVNLFSSRRFINVYFLGVILGGIIFLLSYNIFPALTGKNNVLVGASAGVTAVLIFLCTYMPNQEVRVVFFNVKLWHVGAFFVLTDLIQIGYGTNIGGRLAHLGGAFLGYIYAKKLMDGVDIGSGFSGMIDWFLNLFNNDKKAPLKTVYRKPTSNLKKEVSYEKETHQRQVDAILDKISKSGYESLSSEEKDFLFKAGKE